MYSDPNGDLTPHERLSRDASRRAASFDGSVFTRPARKAASSPTAPETNPADNDGGDSPQKGGWFQTLRRVARSVIPFGGSLLGRRALSADALDRADRSPELDSSFTGGQQTGPRGKSTTTFRNYVISRMRRRRGDFITHRPLRVSVCTWNVAQQAPPTNPDDLKPWLLGVSSMENNGSSRFAATAEASSDGGSGAATPVGASSGSSPRRRPASRNTTEPPSPAATGSVLPDIVVVALQEIELGGTALMLEMTDSSVAWMETIVDCLNKSAAGTGRRYKKVEMVQLVGMVLVLISAMEFIPRIERVRKAVTRTGAIAGVMGNKGAIGLHATICGKRFLFIGAHFAAHKHNAQRRKENYHASLAELKFPLLPDDIDGDDLFRDGAQQSFLDEKPVETADGLGWRDRIFRRRSRGERARESERQLLAQHDYVFFFGDLNFRLQHDGIGYDGIVSAVKSGRFESLLASDELIGAMEAGEIFSGFLEPAIRFAPTYKFDMGCQTYDSKKRREPAWTDRVLVHVLHGRPECEDPCLEPESPVLATASPSAAVPVTGFPKDAGSRRSSFAASSFGSFGIAPPLAATKRPQGASPPTVASSAASATTGVCCVPAPAPVAASSRPPTPQSPLAAQPGLTGSFRGAPVVGEATTVGFALSAGSTSFRRLSAATTPPVVHSGSGSGTSSRVLSPAVPSLAMTAGLACGRASPIVASVGGDTSPCSSSQLLRAQLRLTSPATALAPQQPFASVVFTSPPRSPMSPQCEAPAGVDDGFTFRLPSAAASAATREKPDGVADPPTPRGAASVGWSNLKASRPARFQRSDSDPAISLCGAREKNSCVPNCVRVVHYNSCPELINSDHRPVSGIFVVSVVDTDESKRQQHLDSVKQRGRHYDPAWTE